MRGTLAVMAVALAASVAAGDTIRLGNGGTLDGVVLKETDAQVVIRCKYATVTLSKSDIASIQRTGEDTPQHPSSRLSRWDRCIDTVAARPWAADLRQIPATVIDKGVLKHVPYMSHRSGDYEFNIYGDPDAPACLEIGATKELLKSDAAKRECVKVMLALLPDEKDRALLMSLSLAQDRKEREGLTFEVTPETAEDAYGGWWISVYDVKRLDANRATEQELKEITVSDEDVEKEEEAEKEPPKKDPPKSDPKPEPPKAGSSGGGALPHHVYRYYRWVKRDLPFARPLPLNRIQSTPTVRRVYVRGVYRTGGSYRCPTFGARR